MGEACHCVGHRLDGISLWQRTDGAIRQSGTLREGYAWAGVKLGVGVAVCYAQLPIDVGDSGAAVVNRRGEAVGLVSVILLCDEEVLLLARGHAELRHEHRLFKRCDDSSLYAGSAANFPGS